MVFRLLGVRFIYYALFIFSSVISTQLILIITVRRNNCVDYIVYGNYIVCSSSKNSFLVFLFLNTFYTPHTVYNEKTRDVYVYQTYKYTYCRCRYLNMNTRSHIDKIQDFDVVVHVVDDGSLRFYVRTRISWVFKNKVVFVSNKRTRAFGECITCFMSCTINPIVTVELISDPNRAQCKRYLVWRQVQFKRFGSSKPNRYPSGRDVLLWRDGKTTQIPTGQRVMDDHDDGAPREGERRPKSRIVSRDLERVKASFITSNITLYPETVTTS